MPESAYAKLTFRCCRIREKHISTEENGIEHTGVLLKRLSVSKLFAT